MLALSCEEVVKSAQRALELHSASTGAEPPTLMLGAEDLLPLMVYVVVRSRMSLLPAELAFIAEFLPPAMLYGQEGYALTTMQCACHVALELRDARLGLTIGDDGVPRPAAPPAPETRS